MRKTNWTVVIVSVLAVLLILFVAGSLLGGGRYGGWGMMGPGMMGGWGFSLIGWLAMMLMWLIPLGFVVLTVVGIVLLVKAVGNSGGPVAPGRNCPSCGRGVQADWVNCPYCGESLAG